MTPRMLITRSAILHATMQSQGSSELGRGGGSAAEWQPMKRTHCYHYGTSSWSEKSWLGPFYPPGTKRSDGCRPQV